MTSIYDDDPVKVYLHEVCKVPPLTRDQEIECIHHIRSGDEHAEWAEKDLVEANLTLVVAIAQKHPSPHIHVLDLIQTGNNALIAAVRAFASSDADDFSAYAAPLIESAIRRQVPQSYLQ